MAKKAKRRFKSRNKFVASPKRHGKKQTTKYTGPTPRQNLATSINRRNKTKKETDEKPRRKRRIATY